MHPIAISRRTALKYTAAATATSSGATEPSAGLWRTWFLAHGSDLRLPGPPDSRAEIPEVRGMVGSADAATLDRVAYWNAGAPPYRWNEIAIDMSIRGAFGTSNFGRIQAYLNM